MATYNHPMYQSSALRSREVKDFSHRLYKSVAAGLVAAAIALTPTDVPRKMVNHMQDIVSTRTHAPRGLYMLEPYIVQRRDTLDQISGNDPLMKEYIIRSNKITNEKIKPGDILDVPQPAARGKTLTELLNELPK